MGSTHQCNQEGYEGYTVPFSWVRKCDPSGVAGLPVRRTSRQDLPVSTGTTIAHVKFGSVNSLGSHTNHFQRVVSNISTTSKSFALSWCVWSFTMDRGTSITDACRAHLQDASLLDIRQTRRGWIQECLGCQAQTEFKYYNADKNQIAHSLEEANCFCRIFCRYVSTCLIRLAYQALRCSNQSLFGKQSDSSIYYACQGNGDGCRVVEC